MRGKKKAPTPIAKIRKSGVVRRDLSPAYRAGRYWRGAYYMLPKFNLWIKLNCLVALLGALACLLIVFSRPRPILLVSFPDGTTACSLPPLDPATGRVLPRPSQEAELCAMLAKRSGRGTDEENAEFAKIAQVEPPAEEKEELKAPSLEDAESAVLPPAPATSTSQPEVAPPPAVAPQDASGQPQAPSDGTTPMPTPVSGGA